MSVQAAEYTALPAPTVEFVDAKIAEQEAPVECKVYKRRWLILAIFVMYSTSNSMQWIQYSIITNVIMDYYQVSLEWVNWTSMIYMITYIPLIFPASWALDKWGLRVACIIGAAGTCIGAWIKVFSVGRDLFYVAFIGQTIVACSQVFVLSVPARLAAVWFGPDQVSSACSIGVFGNQLGVAIGFLFPPMMVRPHPDFTLIGEDLRLMYYVVAGVTSVVFLMILFGLQNQPRLPPSAAQAIQRAAESSGFVGPLKRLACNLGYVLLLISYGINVGVFYAISTLLNQVVLEYFPGKETDVGRIGLTIVVAGMLGSVACGIALDKTHRFKEVTLAVYILSLVGMVVYTYTLNCGYIIVVYCTAALLGFFMTGYLPVGFEFAAELTYPEPEGTSAGLLNASSQVFGLVFTTFYTEIFTSHGDKVANLALCATLCLGSILTACVKSNLRRQKAHVKQDASSPVKGKY